jgi:hypothetical protein
VAVGFAGLLNAVFAATLVWPEIAPPMVRVGGLAVAALWWMVAGLLAWRELPELQASTAEDPWKGLFVAAQAEYLKGNWIEAESSLRKLLRQSPRDAEAQLLWATLMRRTARLDKARQSLQDLSRLDAASHWQHEIRTERELVRRMTEQQRLASGGRKSPESASESEFASESESASEGRESPETSKTEVEPTNPTVATNRETIQTDDQRHAA